MNYSAIKEKEMPRIEKVIKNFIIYRTIEIILILTAFLLIYLYKSNIDKYLLFGIGIGLAIQAGIMFAGDSFAAKNAKNYLEGLKVYKPANMHL
jgi:hypothetical protein